MVSLFAPALPLPIYFIHGARVFTDFILFAVILHISYTPYTQLAIYLFQFSVEAIYAMYTYTISMFVIVYIPAIYFQTHVPRSFLT